MAPWRCGGQETADRGSAADHHGLEVEGDQVKDLTGRCGTERRVAEHGSVVDPAGEASHSLREIRGSFGNGFIHGAASDRHESGSGDMARRPIQGIRVKLDHHNGVAVARGTTPPCAPWATAGRSSSGTA